MTEKHNPVTTPPTTATRRDFLTTAAVAGTALAAGLNWVPSVHAGGNDVMRVGLIGCGGRGTQAAENVLSSTPGIKIVALGDVFEDRLKGTQNHLKEYADKDHVKKLGNSVDLPNDRCHLGLDAYQKVLDTDINYVILATPPGFRPIHLEAAVAAGKNIFTEKPVGVDGLGIRKVLAAYEVALKKGLGIVAGTQRRHQLGYLEMMKRLKDGAIGDLVGGRGYWLQDTLWERERKPGMSEAQYQIHNWYGFTWLSGDHIVEQHVHNIDVVNWALGGHPVRAVGMGFRTPRDEGYGHIYNFFAIDYEFPKGVHSLSMCRQISNCHNGVYEEIVGSKGIAHMDAGAHLFRINGQHVVSKEEDRDSTNPYVQEHADLVASIRAGKPLNELKTVAESTLTAIMGRMSGYTGKPVTWEQALTSREDLYPKDLKWDGSLPNPPVAIPGTTPLV